MQKPTPQATPLPRCAIDAALTAAVDRGVGYVQEEDVHEAAEDDVNSDREYQEHRA